MAMHGGLLRAQLARETGCNLETIRYYEKVGLLPEPARSANGYRVYPPSFVQRLRFVLRARDLGFTLDEIRSLFLLTDTGTQTCAEVMARTQVHLADVREKIGDLRRIEATLVATLGQCSGTDGPECAVLEALNRTTP